jgi:hypothetical protein
MDAEERDPLTPGERAELRAWRQVQPPPALEGRLVRALAATGAIVRPSRHRRVVLALAAAVIFALGLAAGRSWPRENGEPRAALRTTTAGEQTAGTEHRFMLLLTGAPPADAAAEADRVREYRAWAAELEARGSLAGAAKLSDGGSTVVPPGTVSDDPLPDDLQGYFVIMAQNLQQAVAVARTCPHLRHGGKIRVRPIDPT